MARSFLCTHDYPAEIVRDEDGRHVVAFPDLGWGTTEGATRREALAETGDPLRELIAAPIREGEALPEQPRAGKRRPLVLPPVQITYKAARYKAWSEPGISQRRLTRDLGIAESEVPRMPNPHHGTRCSETVITSECGRCAYAVLSAATVAS